MVLIMLCTPEYSGLIRPHRAEKLVMMVSRSCYKKLGERITVEFVAGTQTYFHLEYITTTDQPLEIGPDLVPAS